MIRIERGREVGPGLPHTEECKHLAGCLSQPSVSLGTEGGIDLHLGGRYTGVSVRPDFEWPGMWRVHQGDRASDMVNLSRAKDAAISWARPRGLGSSEVARWHHRETAPGGAYGAFSEETAAIPSSRSFGAPAVPARTATKKTSGD